MIDEKYRSLKSDLSREIRHRQECVDECSLTIERDFPRLLERVNEISLQREDADAQIVTKMGEDIGDLNIEMTKERNAREENEQAMFDMLRDIVERIKRELENEKKDRETAEETLMGLLEDTCNKLHTVLEN